MCKHRHAVKKQVRDRCQGRKVSDGTTLWGECAQEKAGPTEGKPLFQILHITGAVKKNLERRVHTQGLDFLGKARSNAGLAKGTSRRRSENAQKVPTTVTEKRLSQ